MDIERSYDNDHIEEIPVDYLESIKG